MTTAHRIGATDFATPSDTEIEATRVVDAPRELVFDCWTKAEHVTKWMLGPEGWTMPVCEIDLRPGGSWHFKWSRADGCEMEMQGTYEEIAPPERLAQWQTLVLELRGLESSPWPALRDSLAINETRAFAEKLRVRGDAAQCGMLTTYATNLLGSADAYAVGKMEGHLAGFPKLVDSIASSCAVTNK